MVLWNSLYLDRAAKQLAADGFPVTDDLLARLSPLQFDHINLYGRFELDMNSHLDLVAAVAASVPGPRSGQPATALA
ncbi:Tn3 family transposase [Streptomyces sp. NPDC002466]|uniref:Tn3 family transposase n=1 Tax=unclassified Streptomyces TaxID=2593676 RepID=UPI0035E262DA